MKEIWRQAFDILDRNGYSKEIYIYGSSYEDTFHRLMAIEKAKDVSYLPRPYVKFIESNR